MTGSGDLRFDKTVAISADAEFLLLDALELPPERRPEFLLQATENPELRELVLKLLEVHARGHENFSRMAQRLDLHELPALPTPGRVGPFRIERELGRGGMSVVYLGVRDDGQFSQQVAIKFLPSGPALESLLRRFESERQILAGMEHPNLARLLDGGISEEGWPYFVMEYVDGLPITRFCDDQRLSINQRLQLLRQVLDVVQYAHQNLVVHRDLKPSNILVTADGRVKLLDFGIAKVLEDGATSAEATLLTQVGGYPLTPAYASPEQVAGDPVTTASDVYSLGVLLYQLLTGLSPYRVAPDLPARLRQAVLTEVPMNPSTRVREMSTRSDGEEAGANAADFADLRSTTPGRLARQLKGDLDIICQMALRKEPVRRYATVAQLAADLDRYQNRLPVLARTGNWRYLTGRFLRRHAIGLAAGILVPVVVIGGLVLHADRLSVERDRAEASAARAASEAAKSRQVTEYLVSLFRSADPAQSGGKEITAIELVQRGTEQTEQLVEDPALQAEMFRVLGQVNQALGRYQTTSELLSRSLSILDSIPGPKSPEHAELLAELAISHFQLGHFEEAERMNRAALAELPKEDLLRRAPVLTNLGIVHILTSRYDVAQSLLEQAVQAHEAAGVNSPDHATARNALGTLLSRQGRHAEAIAMLEQAVQLRMSLFGTEHPATSIALSNLGIARLEAGDPAGAEAHLMEALAVDERLLGDDHPNLAILLNQVASAKRSLGDTTGAIEYLERALAIHRAHFEPNHPGIAVSLSGLGTAYLLREDWPEAERALQEVIAINEQTFGPASREQSIDLVQLGFVRLRQGRLDEAQELLQQGLAIAFEMFGEQHALVGRPLRYLAEVHWERGERTAALESGNRSLAILTEAFGAEQSEVMELRQWLQNLGAE